jgi:hypothetical protein
VRGRVGFEARLWDERMPMRIEAEGMFHSARACTIRWRGRSKIRNRRAACIVAGV